MYNKLQKSGIYNAISSQSEKIKPSFLLNSLKTWVTDIFWFQFRDEY